MPTVRAGYMNWSTIKPSQGLLTKSGRTRNVINEDNMQWDLSTGWHFKRKTGWRKDVKKPKTQTLHDFNGREYKVYDYGEFDDYIGFRAGAAGMQDRLAYATLAFDQSRHEQGEIYHVDGIGHISKLEYAVKEQVLRVTFTNNGAICLFFKVPNAVAGELFMHAITGTTAGTYRKNGHDVDRHLLGVKFWDYVRIRGMQTGARYPFEYEQHGVNKINRQSTRHYVTIDNADMMYLYGTNKQAEAFKKKDFKPGEKISVVLNDEEWTKYLNELKSRAQEQSEGSIVNYGEAITTRDKETGEVKTQIQDISGKDELEHAKSETKANLAKLIELKARANKMQSVEDRNAFIAEVRSQFDEAEFNSVFNPSANKAQTQQAKQDYLPASMQSELKDELRKQINNRYESLKHNPRFQAELTKAGSSTKFISQAVEDFADKNMAEILDKRYSTLPLKNKYSSDSANIGDLAKAAGKDRGFIRRWDIENTPAKLARGFTGRGWTPQELKEFANDTVPGNISKDCSYTYKKLVQARDWDAALDFLKSHKAKYTYKGKTLTEPYASQYDFVDVQKE